ncbi:hypothetical protein K3495_g8848 [Podosphaera aphanis]|nr:hypothetical protein K3495_g8848 [Podosphaera aphanis]
MGLLKAKSDHETKTSTLNLFWEILPSQGERSRLFDSPILPTVNVAVNNRNISKRS